MIQLLDRLADSRLTDEKDWHISTESLFIVMKLVRVGELNA